MQNKNKSNIRDVKEAKLSDNELITRILGKKDQRAYTILVQRYIGKMYRLSISVLKNDQEAEDAVQDVFVSLMKSLQTWDNNGQAKFSTWIYRVTYNKCIDIKRKRKKTESTENLELASREKTAYQATLNRQLSERLAELLQTLPGSQGNALRLYYYHEMSVQEICGELRKSEESIRSLLKRGKACLKEKMQIDPAFQSLDIEGLSQQLWQ